MTRQRRLLIIAAALLGCLLLAAIVLDASVAPVLARVVASRTGHVVHLPRGLSIHWGLRPALDAPELVVDNPPWMPAGETAHVSGLRVVLRWQLALVPLRAVSVEAAAVQLHLMRDAEARANWQAQPGVMGQGPPLLARVYAPNVEVGLDDERLHLKFRGTASLDGRDPLAPVRLVADGELNGRPARIEISGAPLATTAPGSGYEFKFDERSGPSVVVARGQLPHALDLHDVEADFTLHGPSLDELFYLAGLHLPATAPFRASGHFTRHDLDFRYSGLRLQAGHSDLSGEVRVAAGAPHAPVTGHLRSEELSLADLSGRGAAASARPGAGFAGLSRHDWDLRYEAVRLQAGSIAARDVRLHAQVRDGVLDLPVTAALGGGSLTGRVTLTGRESGSSASLEWSARDLDLSDLGSWASAHVAGRVSTQGRLEARGSSLAALLASAHGSAAAVLPSGSMSRPAAEATAVEFRAAWDQLVHADAQTPVRCALLGLQVRDGTAALDPLVIDTPETQIRGTGTVRLADGALDLRINGRPKHPTLRLRSPIDVEGTLAHPKVRLESAPALAQAGTAAGLGAALTPLAALAAFVSPGRPGNTDCAALVQAGSALR
ncbi:MAG: hypothetical protein JSS29_01430 [Proteobacteria bacterium]|nr:hypothetical protein [Pseudomonadota bacterium]